MGDLTKNHPKCFLYYKEKRLIEHLISNFKSCGISKIVIVTGYKSELFKQFETFLVFNKNWENSNMLYSLYCSLPYMSENSIVTYADIFYEKNIIKKLKESKNNFCVACSWFVRSLHITYYNAWASLYIFFNWKYFSNRTFIWIK